MPDFVAPGADHQFGQPIPDQPSLPPESVEGNSSGTSRKIAPVVVGVVIGLIVIGAIVGYVLSGAGSAGNSQACPSDAICVTADKILQDYTDNVEAAQDVYQGRYVEISGTLASAIINETDQFTALLKGSDTSFNSPYVGCRDLPRSDVHDWEEAHPNTWKVVLTGSVVTGEIGSRGTVVVLIGCRLKL